MSNFMEKLTMERHEIIPRLKESHSSFVKYIDGLTDDEFLYKYQEKWTAGQQLEHIYLAVRPVVLAFKLPKFLIGTIFGQAKHSGRTYDELVKKYQYVLQNGGKSSRPFVPKNVKATQKEKLIKALTDKVTALCSGVETCSEQELDTLVLPHPLLGKLTMREMLYFTIYHVGHHHQAVKRNLELRS